MASSSSPTTLPRSDSIADKMPDALKQSRYHMKRCFASFVRGGKKLMKRENLMNEIEKCIEDGLDRKKIMEGLFGYILTCTQEAAVVPPYVALAARPDPGFWEYVKVNAGDLTVDEITATDFLKLKESVFDESWAKDENALELDFGAIDFTTPRLNLSSSIGNGADYISKFISSKLGGNTDKLEPLLNYLLRLNHHGENLMINEDINTVAKLQKSLMLAVNVVSTYPKHTPCETFAQRLKEMGFEKVRFHSTTKEREEAMFLRLLLHHNSLHTILLHEPPRRLLKCQPRKRRRLIQHKRKPAVRAPDHLRVFRNRAEKRQTKHLSSSDVTMSASLSAVMSGVVTRTASFAGVMAVMNPASIPAGQSMMMKSASLPASFLASTSHSSALPNPIGAST
ncbi:hypothetical protein Bca52824_083113 [Brassica carinata]|uniref:sucrose synthase n=1 Tax=Brassica carinata TaxID=52824 RepID=A0A8X7TST0_BRACI|nr:hypothetical protein Bca52824_083113 [Brassica carinata]